MGRGLACGPGACPRHWAEGGLSALANKYTAVPHAYLDECDALTDAEFGLLMRGLLRYSIDGTPIEAGGNARFFARRMMNQEDLNRARWEQISRRRAEAGRIGGLASRRGSRGNAEAGADGGADDDAVGGADDGADDGAEEGEISNCLHKLS